MRQLDDELNTISTKIEKVVDLMNAISCDVGEVQDTFDLYDFSVDNLDKWNDDLNPLINRMGRMSEEFDTFAFDGDSIREVDEDED